MTQNTTTAELLAGYLKTGGVKHVFGYPGESVVEFMDAAQRAGLTYVCAAREASAAFMAEGAAAATGRIGACLSTLGPGSTALLNGVAAATLDRVPVLAISGQADAAAEQYLTHQIVDQGRLFAPVAKLVARLEPDAADAIIRRALRTATAERPGAVHLTVATQAWAAQAQGSPEPFPAQLATSTGYGHPGTALREARRPVILAGTAATRTGAGPALKALAEGAGIPVVVSPMAKGIFPEDHPCFAGVLDMAGHRVIWQLLDDADLIVTAGFDPVELISPWAVATPVMHVDTQPNTDQVYRSGHEIVGDVAAALAWLTAECDGGEPRWTEAEIAEHRAVLRAAWQAGYAHGKLNPSEVVTTVREAMPETAIVTTDVGSHKIMAGQAWQAARPREVLICNGLSAMGFGVPAAIAASLEHPDRPVVALTGDGGFAMTATELAVAAELRLPLTVVVFADGSLNRIELRQQALGLAPSGTRVAKADVPGLAQALGCDGVRVDSVVTLEKALEGQRHRPLVIEARVDPSQYFAQF